MLVYKNSSPTEAKNAYFKIELANGDRNFVHFRSFASKVISGGFSLLKNRFEIDSLIVSDQGCEVFVAQIFKPKASDDQHTFLRIGSVAVDKNLAPEKLRSITAHLQSRYALQVVIGPWNGHMNLGFTSPDPSTQIPQLAFMESMPRISEQMFFGQNHLHRNRTYLALKTQLTATLTEDLMRIQAERPPQIQIRPISLLHFRRDMQIFNTLVNQCMTDHPQFEALNFAEFWEVFKGLWPLANPRYFLLMFIESKPVGFCFAVPDYNSALKNRSDLSNVLTLLWIRFFPSKSILRGRIVYSGILPLYRSQKIFKYLRNAVLINMAKDGIQEVISSYIDQDNTNSLGNVRARGAVASHTFSTYRL